MLALSMIIHNNPLNPSLRIPQKSPWVKSHGGLRPRGTIRSAIAVRRRGILRGWTGVNPWDSTKNVKTYIYIWCCAGLWWFLGGFRGNWNLKLQGLEKHFPSCNAHKPGFYLNPMFILRQGHRKVQICDSGDQRILHCYGPKKHPVVVWAFSGNGLGDGKVTLFKLMRQHSIYYSGKRWLLTTYKSCRELQNNKVLN